MDNRAAKRSLRHGNPLREETPKEEKETIEEVHETKYAESDAKNEFFRT
jgi:hypothetical protein